MREITPSLLKGEKVSIFKIDQTQENMDRMEDASDDAYGSETVELFDAEIGSVIEELATEHPDTEKYTASVRNLETLTKAQANYASHIASITKAGAEYANVATRNKVNWGEVAPKIAGIAVYGLVTMLFVAIEREHPPAMRLVQAANTLVNPRI